MVKNKKNMKTKTKKIDENGVKIEIPKIEVICCDCGIKFKTTEDWFNNRNKDGKLPCRKCRMSRF